MIDLVWLASLLSIVIPLCGVLWSLHRFLTHMEKRFDAYDATLRENTIQILKMTLLCDDLPITDRLEAGAKYIELGGNGYGHIVYDKLLKELEARPPIEHK